MPVCCTAHSRRTGDTATRLRIDIVDGLPHVIDKPGDVARVRALANPWFLRYMQAEKGA